MLDSRPDVSDAPTKKPDLPEDEIRDEYDFSEGLRGKYAGRLEEGCSVVVLDPDVAASFQDSRAVNEALRAYLADKISRS